MEITAQQIIDDIKSALKQFGEYTYYDKGADEVMDVYKYTRPLKDMGAEKAITLLEEVEKYEHSSSFLIDIIMFLDDWDNEEGDKFFQSDLVGRHY